MRSKAGREGAGYLIEDEGGNAKGTAERIIFGAERAVAFRMDCSATSAIPHGTGSIDKFDTPLPVTADRRIEAALTLC